MRILHTSDWHMGKSLKAKPRLNEQRRFLDQLYDIINDKKVDVMLIAGDIFDTFVPKAEAEQLLYDGLARLSEIVKIVVLPGNHDDGERLSSPKNLALLSNIFLINGMDNTALTKQDAEGGDGWLRLKINNEMLNIAALPYPFFSSLLSQADGETNEQRVQSLIDRCVNGFGEGVNVFMSHLFISGTEVAEERELGTAPILPKGILPKCDYAALGHIHKPQKLSKSRHIYYSGSPLKYSFDDNSKKSVYIFNTADNSVEQVEITAGQQLIEVKADSFSKADEQLTLHADAFVKLVYSGMPLTLNEIKGLKAHKCLTDIRIEQPELAVPRSFRADASPKELFELFYKAQSGQDADGQLTELFLSILGGEQ